MLQSYALVSKFCLLVSVVIQLMQMCQCNFMLGLTLLGYWSSQLAGSNDK